jgi:DNA-directed RNA polymerase specialized sigma subunit
MYLDYEDDLNCTLIAVDKHGAMTLREVAPRLGVSFVRVKQVEDVIMKKMRKKMREHK